MTLIIAIQIIGSISALVAMWLIGNKNRLGLVIGMIGDVCFITLNITFSLWIVAGLTVIISAFRIRALLKWR